MTCRVYASVGIGDVGMVFERQMSELGSGVDKSRIFTFSVIEK